MVKLDLAGYPQGLGALIVYNDELDEYLIILARKTDSDVDILGVGVESTQEDAERWAEQTIRLMVETGDDKMHMPTKHERAMAH